MDAKTYPENVDVVLVEGAVANEDNLEMIKRVRERSKVLVSFGDCAVTGNVTALRNPLGRPWKCCGRCMWNTATSTPACRTTGRRAGACWTA